MSNIVPTAAQIAFARQTADLGRDATIKAIRTALRQRSGKAWSVKGGRGTAWGWIRIDAPPARCTWGVRLKDGATTTTPEDFEECDMAEPGHDMSPADRQELGRLLGLETVHRQGESIPAGREYYREYICRALSGNPGPFQGKPYWD